MKICVIIPTLNEEKNISKLFDKIKKTKIRLDILFIDDSSTDNSQKIIKKLKKKNSYIKYIFRNNKVGIGSAHKDGIKYVYKKKYDLLISTPQSKPLNPTNLVIASYAIPAPTLVAGSINFKSVFIVPPSPTIFLCKIFNSSVRH